MEKTQNDDIHPKSQWAVSNALKNVKRHIGSQSKRKDRQMSVEIPPAPSVTVNSASLIGTQSLQLNDVGY